MRNIPANDQKTQTLCREGGKHTGEDYAGKMRVVGISGSFENSMRNILASDQKAQTFWRVAR